MYVEALPIGIDGSGASQDRDVEVEVHVEAAAQNRESLAPSAYLEFEPDQVPPLVEGSYNVSMQDIHFKQYLIYKRYFKNVYG